MNCAGRSFNMKHHIRHFVADVAD